MFTYNILLIASAFAVEINMNDHKLNNTITFTPSKAGIVYLATPPSLKLSQCAFTVKEEDINKPVKIAVGGVPVFDGTSSESAVINSTAYENGTCTLHNSTTIRINRQIGNATTCKTIGAHITLPFVAGQEFTSSDEGNFTIFHSEHLSVQVFQKKYEDGNSFTFTRAAAIRYGSEVYILDLRTQNATEKFNKVHGDGQNFINYTPPSGDKQQHKFEFTPCSSTITITTFQPLASYPSYMNIIINAAAFYSHSGISGICGAKKIPLESSLALPWKNYLKGEFDALTNLTTTDYHQFKSCSLPPPNSACNSSVSSTTASTTSATTSVTSQITTSTTTSISSEIENTTSTSLTSSEIENTTSTSLTSSEISITTSTSSSTGSEISITSSTTSSTGSEISITSSTTSSTGSEISITSSTDTNTNSTTYLSSDTSTVLSDQSTSTSSPESTPTNILSNYNQTVQTICINVMADINCGNLVDVNAYTNICISESQISGSLVPIESTKYQMLADCGSRIDLEVGHPDSNKADVAVNIQVSLGFNDNKCPSGCSNNGLCTQNGCVCNTYRTGLGCETNLSNIVAPVKEVYTPIAYPTTNPVQGDTPISGQAPDPSGSKPTDSEAVLPVLGSTSGTNTVEPGAGAYPAGSGGTNNPIDDPIPTESTENVASNGTPGDTPAEGQPPIEGIYSPASPVYTTTATLVSFMLLIVNLF